MQDFIYVSKQSYDLMKAKNYDMHKYRISPRNVRKGPRKMKG